jgi:YD repeat-containing protein
MPMRRLAGLLILTAAFPATADAPKVRTSAEGAACPLVADTTLPWTHDLFPTCSTYAFQADIALPNDQPCESVIEGPDRHDSVFHLYDASGNWTEMAGHGWAAKCFRKNGHLRSCDVGTEHTVFTFDSSGRITEVLTDDNDKTKRTYGYDDKGDLVTVKQGGVETRLEYDADHRLVAERTANNTAKYRYDDKGRLLARGNGDTLTYDDSNRVSKINRTGQTQINRYDEAGRLVTSTWTSTEWGRDSTTRASYRYNCPRQ